MGWVTAKIAVGAFLILAGLSYRVTGFVAAYEGGIRHRFFPEFPLSFYPIGPIL
jgi:hypothetical protein